MVQGRILIATMHGKSHQDKAVTGSAACRCLPVFYFLACNSKSRLDVGFCQKSYDLSHAARVDIGLHLHVIQKRRCDYVMLLALEVRKSPDRMTTFL